jgi:dihydroxy-acid dehydratase
VKDGDLLSIDIPKRKLEIKIPEGELRKRLSAWKAPKPKIKNGFMGMYAANVGPADEGALLHR